MAPVRDAADEMHVDLGGRIPHVWVHMDEGRLSTLDLVSPGLTLFTGPESARREAAPSGGPPVTVRRLDAISARALGIRGAGELLVRPDGAPSSVRCAPSGPTRQALSSSVRIDWTGPARWRAASAMLRQP